MTTILGKSSLTQLDASLDKERSAPAARLPIMLNRCTACGQHSSLSPAACSHCGGQLFDRVAASGRGTVRARSEVWRAPDAAWREHVPYTLVLVRLEEGPTLMGHAPSDIAIGDSVSASTNALGERLVLMFQRRPSGEPPRPGG